MYIVLPLYVHSKWNVQHQSPKCTAITIILSGLSGCIFICYSQSFEVRYSNRSHLGPSVCLFIPVYRRLTCDSSVPSEDTLENDDEMMHFAMLQ